VSLWLNSGVPVTKVARRAGHGVAILLKSTRTASTAGRRRQPAHHRRPRTPGSQPGPDAEGDDDDSEQTS
jgi:hypothetical protein